MFRGVIALLVLGVLSACASLSEDECRIADWQEVGFEDGTNGKSAAFLSRHIKACEKHGVRPQQTPWNEGREAGLRIFCVPESAYRVGRNGRSFPAVCTPTETIAMRPAFDWGRQYYELSAEIDELESDIRSRLNYIDDLEDPEDPIILAYLRYNNSDERRIWRLERLRRKYAFWPPHY